MSKNFNIDSIKLNYILIKQYKIFVKFFKNLRNVFI